MQYIWMEFNKGTGEPIDEEKKDSNFYSHMWCTIVVI